MQISGSIFAVKNNWFEYAKILKVSKVDFLHIDLFDNQPINFHLEDIKQFDKSYLPLDVHLIYEKVNNYEIEILNSSNVYYLNVQYETLECKDDIIKISKAFQGNFGLAITTKVPLEVIDRYIGRLSQILIMCSEPGVSGAKFDTQNYERIRLLRDKYPNLPIFVDGGIDDIVAEKMNKLGVKLIVSGSYLAKYPKQIPQNVYTLKFANDFKIPVTRNMIPLSQLPLTKIESPFIDIIDVMNAYRLGIVFVSDQQKLIGTITDGDVRRAYLKYKEGLFGKKAIDIMNSSPLSVTTQETINEVFQLVTNGRYKGIYVVPILSDNKLVGALDLHIN